MAIDPEIEARLDWLERAMIVLAESIPGVRVRLPPRPGAVDGGRAPSTGFAGSPDANAEQEIRALIEAGHTLRAIKIYQRSTGAGLKDAKREIERLERADKRS